MRFYIVNPDASLTIAAELIRVMNLPFSPYVRAHVERLAADADRADELAALAEIHGWNARIAPAPIA